MDVHELFLAVVLALAPAWVLARAWTQDDPSHESGRAMPPAVQATPLHLGETVLVDLAARDHAAHVPSRGSHDAVPLAIAPSPAKEPS